MIAACGLAVLLSCVFPTAARAETGPTTFVELFNPVGVTTDASGNVFVTHDGASSTLLTKFAPDGQVLGQVAIPALGTVGRLAIDSRTGLWDLLSDGRILLIDPAMLTGGVLVNLNQLAIDTTDVYDIQAGFRRDMSGTVVTSLASWGDIALLRRGDQLDVFLSGFHQGFPFVVRLRIVGTNPMELQSAKAIVSTSLSPCFEDPLARHNCRARGVAVNAAGTVLTTLPFGQVLAPFDRAVAFGADYPGDATFPPRLLFGGADVTSRGIGTNAAGVFYVATGEFTTTPCDAAGNGAIMIVSPQLTTYACRSLGLSLVDSRDAAVNPTGDTLYATYGFPYWPTTTGVLKWEQHVPFPPPPSDVPADFDGDRDSDFSVWRPATGTWYAHGGLTEQWGVSSDVPVPGQYDVDSATDVAVWRPADGTWYVQGGATQQWGISTDVPVPGDYHGDDGSEFAVWRPQGGTWYVQGGATQQWGISTDVPVPGDYDGDGDTDFAVWRPVDGTWYVQGGLTQQWGIAGDIPVPGQYDADAATDIAVWRPSSGTWYVQGGATQQWGISTDVPVQGNYDGDGDTDFAVWRPSEGIWYVQGGATQQWGIASDKPLPPLPSVARLLFP